MSSRLPSNPPVDQEGQTSQPQSNEALQSPGSSAPAPEASRGVAARSNTARRARLSDRISRLAGPKTSQSVLPTVLKVISVFALLYLFLVGVQCLSGGIKGLGAGIMDRYLGEQMNPILGLLVGVLATTLVQSSSVTTSLIVGLVGSGELSVSAAIPMIMGANIGTTVTNTIASLAHATRSSEFKRAFSAATCHDFFNFLSVITLLPLEVISRAIFGRGQLEMLSSWLAVVTSSTTGTNYKSPFKAAIKKGASVISDGLNWVADEPKLLAGLLAVAGCLIIFTALFLIVTVMRSLVLSKVERYINRVLGSSGLVGIAVGIVLTIMVQSSSITTSVLIPLAGAGLITLNQVFPITLGANIGTTVTALLASLVVSGDASVAARQIALVHLIFNLQGMLIWYVPSRTREVPLRLAHWMSEIAAQSARWAVVYVLAVFFGLPALIFAISRFI